MSGTPIRITLVILLVLAGVLIAANLRPVERLVNEGPTLEVLRNDYFAAGRFIENGGVQIVHQAYPVDAASLSPGASLLLTDSSYLEGSRNKAVALLSWVESGGRLIWQYSPDAGDNPLASLLGITRRPFEPEKATGESVQKQLANSAVQGGETVQGEGEELTPTAQVRYELMQREQDADVGDLGRIDLPVASGLRIQIASDSTLTLAERSDRAEFRPELQFQSSANGRVDLMNFQLGLGQVTLLSDAGIWSNGRIGLFDHALLLRWLVQDSEELYIQRYTRWPTLVRLIGDKALEPALILILMLVLWIVGQARRFGPVAVMNTEQRRSLSDHVDVVARYHHQRGQYDLLLGPLRRQILTRASGYHPGFEQLSEQAQHSLIADRTSIPVAEVARALHPADSFTKADLVRIVPLLINIRNQL